MSVYLSLAPSIQAARAENTSAFPEAPQVETLTATARSRTLAAALLRRTARIHLAVAARLERPVRQSPATA